ncbi:hypothetical protein ACOI1C_10825 [Bacillus sp. DJP31]|uniref:hypothetical protein n=1 Tax=Bacillus sp. DJP31 TaxID=3409789 RepID=UPI003BB7C363
MIITPSEHSIEIVDVRDYNRSYKQPIHGSTNIPIAYLPRFFQEVSNKKIHVVASNHLDKNVSIRFFRKKGYKSLFKKEDKKSKEVQGSEVLSTGAYVLYT